MSRNIRSLTVFLVLVVIIMFAGLSAHAQSPRERSSQTLLVVRIHIAKPDDVQQLIAQGVDVLEIRLKDDIFAIVTPETQMSLLAQGWDVQPDPEQTALLLNQSSLQSFQNGYRTVEETETFLKDMETRYPMLATLVNIGNSWERQTKGESAGYQLLALRMTNRLTPGPKPVFFLMAAIHARELVTAELATRFITAMLTNYGVDPDVTWLLDEHEIVVVPIANPDGRKLAEQGYMQRKNRHKTDGDNCTEPPTLINQLGVDLNRNFAYQWGQDSEARKYPCDEVYPGSDAASEPETQALQKFLQSLYPNHPQPSTGTAAPDDTSGILISLHSYGELVLWPWGHTISPAPNRVGLERLGKQLALLNGYDPQQAIMLYPTSGTTDDWSYATLGIASFTFEVGPYSGTCGGFMPPYQCLDQEPGRGFWSRQLPALLYAAKVARFPYTQPAGPDIQAITVVSDTVQINLTNAMTTTSLVTVTVMINGRDHHVAAAEAYIGSSPWQGGTPVTLEAIDGSFDSSQEQAQVVLPLEHISPSQYHPYQTDMQSRTLLLARGKNINGIWGPMSVQWFPQGQIVGPIVQHIHVLSDTFQLTITTLLKGYTQPISDAYLYLGHSPWQGGIPIALQPLDGSFDTMTEQAQVVIPLQQIVLDHLDHVQNRLLLMVRGRNSNGVWGSMKTTWIHGNSQWLSQRYEVWLPFIGRSP